MAEHRRARSFVSSSPEYQRAFQVFLDHTDQKDNANAWLRRQVDSLPDRSAMIDAGAGSGTLTKWFTPLFGTVVAFEPNPSLASKLRATCPEAIVMPTSIADASPPVPGNFVLCSHVFYYIPRAEWHATVRTLKSWLAPGGIMAVALQNPDSDCMRMVAHFLGGRFDLGELRREADGESSGYEACLETVPAQVRAPDLETACEIAEFVLNVLPMPSPPRWDDVAKYVGGHFKQEDGLYRFSCDQDFLKVTRAV